MTVLAGHAHGHGLPGSSPDTTDSIHSHHMPLHGTLTTQVAPGSMQRLPEIHSELAEIRVSSEDLPSHSSAKLSTKGSAHGSLHNGEMVDILLSDSPHAGR